MIDIMRKLLPVDLQKLGPEELRMKSVIDLHEIQIASHRGQTDKEIVYAYIHFLHTHKGRLFKSQLAFFSIWWIRH